jgi:hypothetical protein
MKCECGLYKELRFGKHHTNIYLLYIYTGETFGLLGIRLREEKYNVKQRLFSKSKLTLNAFEECYMIDWTQLVFYSLSLIILTENIKKKLECCVQ